MRIGKFKIILLLLSSALWQSCLHDGVSTLPVNSFSSVDFSDDPNRVGPTEIGYYCQPESIPEPIASVAVDSDIKLIHFVNGLFETYIDRKGLDAKLSKWKKRTDSLGYDLEYQQYRFSGSYLSIAIKVVYHHNSILELVIDYESSEHLMKDYYYQEIGFPVFCEYGKLRYLSWDHKMIEAYQHKHKGHFWLIVTPGYRNRQYEAIDFFTYPPASEALRHSICHLRWSYLEEAMNHIRYLVVNEDRASFLKILHSISPVGREFAAVCLHYLEGQQKISLSRVEQLQIQKVLTEKTREIIIGENYDHWGEVPEELNLEDNFERYLKEF